MFWKLGLEGMFLGGHNSTHHRWLQPRVLQVFLTAWNASGSVLLFPCQTLRGSREASLEEGPLEEEELNFAPVVPGRERAKGKSSSDP